MSRELRMVPPNWVHPKEYNPYRREMEFAPLMEETYEDACLRNTQDPESYLGDPKEYVPYKKEEATWFQMYETVSSGTPVSPPFATREELISYLSTERDFFGDGPRTVEYATRMVKVGFVPGMSVTPTGTGQLIFETPDGKVIIK